MRWKYSFEWLVLHTVLYLSIHFFFLLDYVLILHVTRVYTYAHLSKLSVKTLYMCNNKCYNKKKTYDCTCSEISVCDWGDTMNQQGWP